MMNNKLEQYMIEKESLCEQRLNEAKLKVTQDWSVEDVKYVVIFFFYQEIHVASQMN